MRKITIMVLAVMIAVGCAFAADRTISDPIQIGVGARPMGMGKAYVALAEDADTVFMNPAGLGSITGPKLTSMYTSLMGDVSYIVIGGAYPNTENSAFGAGIVTNSTSGIDLRDNNQQSLGFGSWGQSDMFVSYGMRIPEAKLQVGGSIKYMTQGGTGTADIEKANASGVSFDVGAVYKPTEQFSVGIVAQNPLGAKLESGNNIENSVPALFTVGTAFRSEPFAGQKLNMAIDADMGAKRATTFHVGLEYFPTPVIGFRIGMDQDPGVGGVETNPTAGIGLRVSGVEFNYAYHPYVISGNDTHYFSIGYVGMEPEKDSFALNLTSPADKSVIYDDNVKIAGNVPKGHKEAVTVNGTTVPVDAKTGEFSATLPVEQIGKKLIVVETLNDKGKKVSEDRRILRLVSFRDVGEGYWAKKPIEHTGTVGLIQGYPDQTFRPDKDLTRAELATILVRTKGASVISGTPLKVFKDVKTSHWAAGYIEVAKRMGLIQGYPNGKFNPNSKVTKAEAIVILARYDKLPTYAVENKPYADVKINHWAAGYIQAAKEAHMLDYVKDVKIRPSEDVTRAESVEMMSHTSLADKLIKDLLSWDTGFQYELSKPMLKAGL